MSQLQRSLLAAIAAIAWTSVVLQFYSSLSRDFAFVSVPARVIDVLSYFTVTTNILVAAVATAGLWPGPHGRPFTTPGAMTASAVYIFVVGVTYAVLLKARAHLIGWPALWADVGLHEVTPVLYLGYWLLYVRTGKVAWRQALGWLAYPAIYVAYTLVRGALVGRYPYFFADAGALGYPRALTNAVLFLLGFLILNLGFIAIGRVKRPSAP